MHNKLPACPMCGKVMQWGEFCECQIAQLTPIDASEIKNSDLNRVARPLLAAVREAMDADPDYRKKRDKWLKENTG